MKSAGGDWPHNNFLSRPARGAWIEILRRELVAGIDAASRPARGAWIEIPAACQRKKTSKVAPRKGRVD